MNEPSSNSGAFIAKLGVWLQLAHVIGFARTVPGMLQAFRELGTAGPGDPAILSAIIGEILMAISIGVALSLIGLLLVLLSITLCRYRATWMFWFLCIYGGLMIFSYFFPFGLFFLIFALVKKDEFLRPVPPALPA